jgi:hypothetical protein
MRLLVKCFAISLVSAVMSLVATAQPLQPTINILRNAPMEQPQFGRSSIFSIVVDGSAFRIAASHALNERIHPCDPTQPLTTLVWSVTRER